GKLLRVLEEGALRRIGETSQKKVDFRPLFATNRNLEEDVRNGRFRGDLFYRINVLRIELPSLRERREDIPLLVKYYIDKTAAEKRLPAPEVTDDALAALSAHNWPGNVRELFNVLERGLVHTGEKTVRPEHLGLKAPPPGRPCTLAEVKAETEREHILRCLDASGGNITVAAKTLGIQRQQLQRLLKRYGMKPNPQAE
ncbi:sigma 54-interacting transcriptional regulator, partial [Acidobacteriota bacterium]